MNTPEIIDMPEQEPQNGGSIRKSLRLLKICASLLLLSFFLNWIIREFRFSNEFISFYILVLIAALPSLVMFLLGPFGLFYAIRSHLRKEGSITARWICTLGHGFFCLLLSLAIMLFVFDFNNLFG